MIYAVLTPEGDFGFRDSESDSVVQTFAFDGGRIQLRYDLDGNREHRVFVDDDWTPWVSQSDLPVGDGLEVDGSGTVSVDDTVVRVSLPGEVTDGTDYRFLSKRIPWPGANVPSYLLFGPVNTVGRALVGTFYGVRQADAGSRAGVIINVMYKHGSSSANYLASATIQEFSQGSPEPRLNTAVFDGETWLAIDFLGSGFIQPDLFFFHGIAQDVEILAVPAASVTNAQPYNGDGSLSFNNAGVVTTTRSITAGTGLTGGGNLSADRTISITPGGVGTSELADNAVTPAKSARLGFRTVTANTTLALGDVDSVIEVNSASARTVTVPTNASVALPVGSVIEIVRWGAGAVTISPASGVTLHSPDDARDIASQYGSAFLRKRDTDEWHLSGDLE